MRTVTDRRRSRTCTQPATRTAGRAGSTPRVTLERWSEIKARRDAQRRVAFDPERFPRAVATFCEHFGAVTLHGILTGPRPPRSSFTELAGNAPPGSELENALVLLAAKSPQTWLRVLAEHPPARTCTATRRPDRHRPHGTTTRRRVR